MLRVRLDGGGTSKAAYEGRRSEDEAALVTKGSGNAVVGGAAESARRKELRSTELRMVTGSSSKTCENVRLCSIRLVLE